VYPSPARQVKMSEHYNIQKMRNIHSTNECNLSVYLDLSQLPLMELHNHCQICSNLYDPQMIIQKGVSLTSTWKLIQNSLPLKQRLFKCVLEI
jgi:hypothetical protein